VPSRNSASWFLVFAHPYGMRTKRAFYCLNTINWDRLTMEERARPPATRSSSSGAPCGESLGDVDFPMHGLVVLLPMCVRTRFLICFKTVSDFPSS
jgi:hypothetical protein